jgi:outer membrane protein assembly factor BamB
MAIQKQLRLFFLIASLLLTAAFILQARGQATLSDMRDAGLIVGNSNFDATDGVFRYDGLGTFIDKLISVPDSASGLQYPCCLTFGPDENLYQSNVLVGNVLRFNGVTGEFIDTFIPLGSGGLVFPLILVFHGDYLYVGDTGTGAIRRYNAATGAFVDNFIPDNYGAVGKPGDQQFFVFGPDGNLYVVYDNRVLRYNGNTGAFIDEFVHSNAGLNGPSGLTFGPDGLLYVGSYGSGEVRQYDVHTGSYEVFIPGGGDTRSTGGNRVRS